MINLELEKSEVPTSWQRDELSIMSSMDDGKTWTEPKIIAKMNKHSNFEHKHWTSSQLSYPHLFEPTPGVIWVTTEAGSLRAKITEDFFEKDN